MKEMLSHEEEVLINKFKNIKNKRWIKACNKSLGAIGLTFEKELGKTADSLYLPDYYGIEIKCTGRYSRYPIGLFTIAFDGPTFPEIERIIELYGYYDKDIKDRKVLFTKLSCVGENIVNNKYKFKLKIAKNEGKIYLEVYDLDSKLIERKSFVYLDSIYNHLMVKLKNLAVIYASKKLIDSEKYFRYYKLELYRLISFEKFIELLEHDDIDVSLIARVNKSGIDRGRYRNKNLVFSIKKKNLNKLFNNVYTYDSDENNNGFNILNI